MNERTHDATLYEDIPSPEGREEKEMAVYRLLKELQTWLWRSAKDFNRLKKKVPPAVVTLRIEARGF